MDRVIYDPKIQERLIDLHAHLAASAYAEDRKSSDANRLEIMYDGRGESLLEVTAFFKHPTFADEREARIVHMEDRKVYDHLKIEKPPHRFRVSAGALIPYVTTQDLVTLPGKYPDKLPIVDVIIGPSRHAEILQRGVERLLAAHGTTRSRLLDRRLPCAHEPAAYCEFLHSRFVPTH